MIFGFLLLQAVVGQFYLSFNGNTGQPPLNGNSGQPPLFDGSAGQRAPQQPPLFSGHIGQRAPLNGNMGQRAPMQRAPFNGNMGQRAPFSGNSGQSPLFNDQGLGSGQSLSPTDESFVKNVSMINDGEIQLGQLALQRSTNPKIKQFARRMITDHQSLTPLLKRIAQAHNLTLSTTLNPDDQATLTKLQGLSNSSFDLAYLQSRIKVHRQAINAFQNEIGGGSVPDITSFVRQILPILQFHLKLAQQTLRQLPGAKGGSIESEAGESTQESVEGSTEAGKSRKGNEASSEFNVGSREVSTESKKGSAEASTESGTPIQGHGVSQVREAQVGQSNQSSGVSQSGGASTSGGGLPACVDVGQKALCDTNCGVTCRVFGPGFTNPGCVEQIDCFYPPSFATHSICNCTQVGGISSSGGGASASTQVGGGSTQA